MGRNDKICHAVRGDKNTRHADFTQDYRGFVTSPRATLFAKEGQRQKDLRWKKIVEHDDLGVPQI